MKKTEGREIFSAIPKDHRDAPRLRCKRLSGEEYLITSNDSRQTFILWRVVRNEDNKEQYERISTGKDPRKLWDDLVENK